MKNLVCFTFFLSAFLVCQEAEAAYQFSVLASFNGANGNNSFSGLVLDKSGSLFGTTTYGGPDGAGTFFELPAGSNQIVPHYLFGSPRSEGRWPLGKLTLDSNGDVYGNTSNGGLGYGTIFRYTPATQEFVTVRAFGAPGDGDGVPHDLVLGSDGELYGASGGASPSSPGTLFTLDRSTGAISTFARFNVANGNGPSGPIMASNGRFYGTAVFGGTSDDGVVYEYSPSEHS